MGESTELQNHKLGELYHQACDALRSKPEKALADAFNSDDPKKALNKLIVRNAVSAETGLVAAFTGNSATDNALDTEPQRVEDIQLVVKHGLVRLGTGLPRPAEDSLKVQQELDAIWLRAEASSIRAKVWQWLHAIAQMSLHGSDAHTYISNANGQLHQVLEEKSEHAAKRQADRRAVGAMPGTELESVVKKTLAAPGISLSPEESRNCLVSCIAYGKVQAKRAEGKHTVVVIGNTGAGKSAFINLLHGCAFELNPEDRMAVRADSAVKELMKIGHTNKSETFTPQVELAAPSFGDGYAFADCPGFLDNRGFEVNVANAVNVKQTLAAAATVRVVVIINYHSLLADRGKGVKDLFHILSGLFGTIENVKNHARSLILAISQAPLLHPETGQAITLERHKEKLLDSSGLDETAKELLIAIGDANVVIYHLLERGDDSWFKRDAIIARITRLVPITEPSNLFRSAIIDADKESLRDLVSDLGKQVQTAIGAAEYDVAADVVLDLLDLKLVEHAWVTTLVDEVTSDVIDDRMAEVMTIVGGQGERDGANGVGHENLGMVEAQKFDDARRELRNMSSVLSAFSGILEVRDKLKALLIEATCQLENTLKMAAEDAGRKEVEEAFREVLRLVGDNVVREVLELPNAAAAMKTKHCDERIKLEEVQADELKRIPLRGLPTEQFDIAQERHAVQLHEASYRSMAAKSMWQELFANAGTKLEQRDQTVWAEESAAFWAKVGWSSERLCTESEGNFVNWASKKLADGDCEVMGTVFRKLGGPRSQRHLSLSCNLIGDPGIQAISDATAFGALPNLEKLYVNSNRIGDDGLSELSRAMAVGRLSKLMFLDLSSNRFGNLGLIALANAITKGALVNVGTLYLQCNMIGDAGAMAFVKALSTFEALAKLEKLWFYQNRIGDLGLQALSDWIAKGGLKSLKSMQLEENAAGVEKSYAVQSSILQMLKERTA